MVSQDLLCVSGVGEFAYSKSLKTGVLSFEQRVEMEIKSKVTLAITMNC